MTTGIVDSGEVKKNRDGKKKVLLLQCEISDPDDLQTVELMMGAGEDNFPPKGSRVAIISTGTAWKIGVAVDDGIEPEVKQGERKIYSSLQGVIKAFAKFDQSGNVELNGNTDNVTAFQDMKDAFDSLKNSVTAMVTLFNTHTHTVSGSSTGIPGSLQVPPTADMSAAKVTSVKVP